MGLTGKSVGKNASRGDECRKRKDGELLVALAGNPNVGKSTVFNILTGLHQHTGNWTGKTVATAVGYHKKDGKSYQITDLPGSYSLSAHSAEEEVARDFICFGGADAVVVVCDATRLCRNLGLVYQILEITPHVLVCLNLMDEARRGGIHIHTEELESLLGVPVVATSAGKGEGIENIIKRLGQTKACKPAVVRYGETLEAAVEMLLPYTEKVCGERLSARFTALRLLENNVDFLKQCDAFLGGALLSDEIRSATGQARAYLFEQGYTEEKIIAEIAASVMHTAEQTAEAVAENQKKADGLCLADRIFTSRLWGIPVMILLVAMIFWLTIVGANYPSDLLSQGFNRLEPLLHSLLLKTGMGVFFADMLTYGLYRVLAWIISVMLPPMAIFFPLFTFLEDVGYLPRVAFNLDGMFSRCNACGKQALTMCMGLGCNAAGVVGARIIDSKRERLIAILTNNFMPCNGRFPAIITVSTIFFAGVTGVSSLITSLVLAAVIVLGVTMTLLTSKALASTILRGERSSFILELPPFRRPQIGKIIVRSVLDRTVFVLGRAVAIAAPAGVLIWLLSNLTVGGVAITTLVSEFLDPLGRLMGLDGAILLAFILGIPANEIVLPLCVMIYLSSGTLSEIGSLSSLAGTLSANGWTWTTAVSFILFSVMHWPCSTTLMTIKKETGSVFYMILSFLLPTVCGVATCMLFHAVTGLFMT